MVDRKIENSLAKKNSARQIFLISQKYLSVKKLKFSETRKTSQKFHIEKAKSSGADKFSVTEKITLINQKLQDLFHTQNYRKRPLAK